MIEDTLPKKKYERALVLSGGGFRGSYQVGVLRYLNEMGWKPDLICGTSAGALNAVGIGCGYSPDDLKTVWLEQSIGSYKLSWRAQLKHFLFRKGFVPFFDVSIFQKRVAKLLDIKALRSSKIEIIITAVNVLTSELKFFSHKVIELEHLMASCSIPILFPWQYIDGEPYWDGSVLMNTPLLPALERKAKEIIVVPLIPGAGETAKPLPTSRKEAVSRLFEQVLEGGSYSIFLAHLNWDDKIRARRNFWQNILEPRLGHQRCKIEIVTPTDRSITIRTGLKASKEQIHSMIVQGYRDAKIQLKEFFDASKKPSRLKISNLLQEKSS